LEWGGLWCVFDKRDKVLGGSFGKSGEKLATLHFFFAKWLLRALCGIEQRQETLVDAHVG